MIFTEAIVEVTKKTKKTDWNSGLDRDLARLWSTSMVAEDIGKQLGVTRNAVQYEIGNPITASKMTRHQLPAALYAPLRVVLFEDEQGRGIFEYDRPSSFFGQYGDERVTEVGRYLDATLEAVLRKAAE